MHYLRGCSSAVNNLDGVRFNDPCCSLVFLNGLGDIRSGDMKLHSGVNDVEAVELWSEPIFPHQGQSQYLRSWA